MKTAETDGRLFDDVLRDGLGGDYQPMASMGTGPVSPFGVDLMRSVGATLPMASAQKISPTGSKVDDIFTDD